MRMFNFVRPTIYCLLPIALSAAIGYWVGEKLEKYESTAVVAAAMDAGQYRWLYQTLSNEQNIRAYTRIKSVAASADPQALTFLQRLASQADPLKTILSPFYRLTREDMRHASEDSKNTSAHQSTVMGLSIAVRSAQPQQALSAAQLLSDFARDTMLQDELKQLVLSHNTDTQTRHYALQAEITRNSFAIKQAQQKINEFKEISAAYPRSAATITGQTINIGSGSERFLSPSVQAAAEAARIVELNAVQKSLQRQLLQIEAQQRLLERFEPILDQAITGHDMARHMLRLVDTVLPPSADEDGAITEIRANYQKDIEHARLKWLAKTPYIAAPTLPSAPKGLNRVYLSVLMGLLAAFLVAVVMLWPQIKRYLLLPEQSA